MLSGIGAFFGERFKMNEQLSEKVDDMENTHLRSEIKAGIRALEQSLVHYAIDIEAHNVSKVVVYSDSSRLVDAAVIWIPHWQPEYLLTPAKEMNDKKFYERLAELIGIFHVQGIKVHFRKVEEPANGPAAALARAAMTRPLPSVHNRDAWVSNTLCTRL